jgi:hypothetical protein
VSKKYSIPRWIVSELYRRDWRWFAIVPAADKQTAISIARSYGMRPKARPMRAIKAVTTKK